MVIRLLKEDEGYGDTGRIGVKVPPALKAEVKALVERDTRLGSMARFICTAISFYLHHYKRANGHVDQNNFPVTTKR
jgi:hypothetical protein